jgi:DNA-directed RNA polymerase specialized sigma24 family protein
VWSHIESLYRAQFRQFERVARAITGDRDLALEAVQEGFSDALRKSGQWAGRGPLEGWVWRCVVNRARKAQRRPVPELPEDHPSNGSPDESELRLRLGNVARATATGGQWTATRQPRRRQPRRLEVTRTG